MNSTQCELTELEGAVLSEIHHRGASTAFKVRRAFQVSPSIEWSGSAGAVYPAIKRLVEAGLIHSEAIVSARKGNHLSLTSDGVARMEAWIANPARAASVGIDPFRLRAGLWDRLPPVRRIEALTALLSVLKTEHAGLHVYITALDPVERRRVELSIQLQAMRIRWVESELTRIERA